MLDIGSGGGLTLSKLAALSKCISAVGVEVESQRHIISCHYNRYLMTTNCDMNIPIWYVNDDIKIFPNFNGFSKIYMYDPVFTPDVMTAIAISFNASASVKMIASTRDLLSFGFDVNLVDNVGSLQARGGKMSHTFYIYESKRYSPEWILTISDIPVKKIVESIDIASSKEKRFKQNESFLYSVGHFEKSPRLSQLKKVLNDKVEVDSPQLFYKLNGQKSSTINHTLFTLCSCTRDYELFNVKELAEVGRSEASAATHKPSKTAVIVPSYDGKENGRILTSIIVDNCKKNNTKYIACVYDTVDKSFNEISLSSAMPIFDHENSFPPGVHLEDVLKVFLYILFACC